MNTPLQTLKTHLANGEPLITLPAGIIQFDEPLVAKHATTIRGVPGYTILQNMVPSMTMLDVPGPRIIMEDITFQSNPSVGGKAVSLGGAQQNAGSKFNNCVFNDFIAGVYGRSVDMLRVYDCMFQSSAPTGATAIDVGNETEGDTYAGCVIDCNFIGPWENGVRDRGHGMQLRGCGFNGPVQGFRFDAYSRTVSVSGESVVLVDGPAFSSSWVNHTIQLNGKFAVVTAAAPLMLTIQSNPGVSGTCLLAYATTGQLNITDCNFDGGTYNYAGIIMRGPNSFYGARISNNRFSNWVKMTDHYNCLIDMPELTEFIFTGNDCAAANAGAESHGLGLIATKDANVNGNTFINLKYPFTGATKPNVIQGINNYLSCGPVR